MGLLRGTHFPDLARKDKKLVGRTSKPDPIEVVAAQGSRLRAADGRTYIDLLSGWCVGNLGWNLPDIVARVHAFEGPTYVSPNMLYEPWGELAELLVDMTPGKLAKAFRCVGGTDAVELALQAAMAATGRHKLVSIEGAYHGNSIAAKSIGEPIDAHLAGCKKLAPPLDAAALGRLETLLKDREIAAFVMEPTIMNLSVLIPSLEFMQGLVPLCHQYGTLVIADEVACGFGRTGKLFACEHYELEPDIMTVAKAITNGVAPLAATLVTNDVAKQLEDELDFYSTFGWHPIAVEAAIATAHYWRDHRGEILQNVVEREAELRHQLSIVEWKSDKVDLRIQGMAVGIGLGDADYAKHIAKQCHDRGLLLEAEDDSLVMFPALTIDHETLAEALEIIAQAAQR